jgi:hypothetical protein
MTQAAQRKIVQNQVPSLLMGEKSPLSKLGRARQIAPPMKKHRVEDENSR